MNPIRFTPVQVCVLRAAAASARGPAPTAPSLSAQAPVRRASTAACHVSQVEALRAAMNPGLTLVVGPPGTGKTDTAVQIVSNIAHTFSSQRTLIITHSNQARNMVHPACIEGSLFTPDPRPRRSTTCSRS